MIDIKEVELIPSRPLIDGNSFPTMVTIYSSEINNLSLIEKDTIDKLSKKSMFGGHFYVRTNGDIYKGRDINKLGEFAYTPDKTISLNSDNIGICLEGDFHNDFAMQRQLNSLVELVLYLKENFSHIRSIKFLREFDDSNNPGLLLPFTEIIAGIDNSLVLSTMKLRNILYHTMGSRELALSSTNPTIGTDILSIQNILTKLGIYNGNINGKYDYLTMIAIKDYQNKNGLNEHGICTFKTIDKLKQEIKSLYTVRYFKRLLYYDDSEPILYGEDVLYVQEALLRKNYNIETNGIYDKSTEEAVYLFQRNNNITPDGKIGPITWDKIITVDDNMFRVLYIKNPPFTGDDVRLIQYRLNELNYRCPITSVYDRPTETQIRLFRKKNGLSPDGIVDKNVFDLLFK